MHETVYAVRDENLIRLISRMKKTSVIWLQVLFSCRQEILKILCSSKTEECILFYFLLSRRIFDTLFGFPNRDALENGEETQGNSQIDPALPCLRGNAPASIFSSFKPRCLCYHFPPPTANRLKDANALSGGVPNPNINKRNIRVHSPSKEIIIIDSFS